SGHIDAIPENVAVLDHDVAHVNANAEFDAFVRWCHGITLGHASLHLGRATQGIDHTGELDEQAITRRLDKPTVVRSDCRIEQPAADGLQGLEGAALVGPNEPRVARDISRQYRGKASGLGHSSGIPALRRPAK